MLRISLLSVPALVAPFSCPQRILAGKHQTGATLALVATMLALAAPAAALDVAVLDAAGAPVTTAMITVSLAQPPVNDTSDNGYPAANRMWPLAHSRTVFSDAAGLAFIADDFGAPVTVRVRKPGYRDLHAGPFAATAAVQLKIERETDPLALALAKPANVWSAAIDLGNERDNKLFRMQCGFCHQQGSAPIRVPRSEAQWAEIIDRMVGYGGRVPTRLHKTIAQALATQYPALLADPSTLGEPLPWSPALSAATIQEWPVGDIYSQMHDMLVLNERTWIVADNLNDRMWFVDPIAHTLIVRKLPHDPDDRIGGMIAARLAAFPKHEDYTALHSLALAPDGHIFMTPSNVRRLIEYDPGTNTFTVHRYDEGVYPHTIRVDSRNRVWWTLALSNQIGMWDRNTATFTAIDLPARSLREAITLWAVPALFYLAGEWGVPIHRLNIDDANTGVPLVYGIDIAPDDTVWFARLHANDIGRIDPETLEPELIPTPFMGPRRLRTDAEGNVWIAAWPESAIYRYAPASKQFTRFDMPTLPSGSDMSYSLAVDRARNIVWVCGTASDTLQAFHIATETWDVFPLPKRMSFCRDIDVLKDGSVITANGAFPAWHIEDAQPTLIHVRPPWAAP